MKPKSGFGFNCELVLIKGLKNLAVNINTISRNVKESARIFEFPDFTTAVLAVQQNSQNH